MPTGTRTTRSRLPRDFFTTRRGYRPYRGYSYGRRRATPAYRDSAYRFPITHTDEPELPWLKPRKPKEEVPPVTEVELATKLHITGVDLHIAENVAAHHTDMYNCTEAREVDGEKLDAELVIRRGQAFTFTIAFDRPYDIKKNDITLVFKLGEEENDANVIERVFKLDETKDTISDISQWGAVLKEKKDKTLTVSVFIPAMAEVGEWQLGIRTTVDVQDGKDIVWQYNHNQEVVILFNPWCKEDLVYMSDETWLKEAVLNDYGCLYYGTYNGIGATDWYFAQFEDVVLETSLHLLRKVFGFESTPAMGSVVRVVRALSKIVNANDDAGVLIGRWGGDYEDGTKPTEWKGSHKILKEYKKNEGPVRYGQCWVFSGVLTTVCRALGIPCRSITNFASAHNSDKFHLSCDVVNRLGPDGEWYEDKVDSIWNFHVWNEVWMSRPDLNQPGKVNYDGWQAIDATPQETSEGVFQCGPSPLLAIKEGQLLVGYDTAFIFAEVNGDKVEWREHEGTGVLMQITREKNAIGRKISTHEPTGEPYKGGRSLERLDITDQYKYPEGTEKEREIVRAAEKMFRLANFDYGMPQPVVERLDFKIPEKEFKIGEPVDLEVILKNNGDIPRTVELYLGVVYTNYRGVVNETASVNRLPAFTIEPGQEKKSNAVVDVLTSIKRPQDGFYFELKAIAQTKETDNIIVATSSFRLLRPEIKVEGPAAGKIGEVVEVALSFTNPLPCDMTSCKLYMEGTFVAVEPVEDKIEIGEIKQGETWKKTVKVKLPEKPRYRKTREMYFSISSLQLGTVDGGYNLTVRSGSA